MFHEVLTFKNNAASVNYTESLFSLSLVVDLVVLLSLSLSLSPSLPLSFSLPLFSLFSLFSLLLSVSLFLFSAYPFYPPLSLSLSPSWLLLGNILHFCLLWFSG